MRVACARCVRLEAHDMLVLMQILRSLNAPLTHGSAHRLYHVGRRILEEGVLTMLLLVLSGQSGVKR